MSATAAADAPVKTNPCPGEADYLGEKAQKWLSKSIEQSLHARIAFLESIRDPEALELIGDPEAFSGMLRYAIDRGFIKQLELSKRIKYANSQVGRWAAGKAAPTMLARQGVLREVQKMIEETLPAEY